MKTVSRLSAALILLFSEMGALYAGQQNHIAQHFQYEDGGKTITHPYVMGTELCPMPDIPKPEKGVSFFDSCFGTKVTRISDRKTDGLKSWGGDTNGSLMHPAYPKHNYDNADGSLLLFNGSYGSGQVLYDSKTFKRMKALSTAAVNWSQPVEPRWDAHDPAILYYHFRPSTALSMYDVRRNSFKVIHDFKTDIPDATSITMAEEGNCSYDSRYFAFQVKAPRRGDKWAPAAVLCYDRVKDQVVGTLPIPIPGFERQGAGNWVGMSPSGKYVLIGTAPMLLYDREFKAPPMKLTHGGGWHSDTGLDDEGREVLFYMGGRTFSPGGKSDGCYAMCDLETGQETVLTRKVGGIRDFHFDCSCVFTPGWGLVSTYHASAPKLNHWTEYSIHLVELTKRKNPPARIWRVAHTHVNRGSYTDDPFATFGRFGRKIFFGSNWGTPIKQDGNIDAYQVDLPSNWYEQLMGREKAERLRKHAEEIVRKEW